MYIGEESVRTIRRERELCSWCVQQMHFKGWVDNVKSEKVTMGDKTTQFDKATKNDKETKGV